MATSVTTYIPSLVFSNDIDEITFSTDLPKLYLEIYNNGTLLYETTLYRYESSLSLYNLSEIIELPMKERGLDFTKFSILYYDEDNSLLGEISLNVIYCAHKLGIEAQSFANQHFLTTRNQKIIHPHSSEFLSFYHDIEDCAISFSCIFFDADNKFYSTEVEGPTLSFSSPGVYRLVLNTDDLVASLAELGYSDVQLASFSVSVGQRSFSFFFSAHKPDVEFTFLNIFNVPEVASFSAVTTAKTSVGRSLAKLRNKAVFYDQTTEKTYDVQTAPLHSSVATWVEQLFESVDVRLGRNLDLDVLPEILITDSTVEITDNNAELNRVKFSWRFADERVHNYSNEASARIFQQQFTKQFC